MIAVSPNRALRRSIRLYYNRIDRVMMISVTIYNFTTLAQLVEHCTGIAEVMGSNPIQA